MHRLINLTIIKRFVDVDDFSKMSMLSNKKAPVMYPIKPIFDNNIKIETPDVMYKSNSIHQESKTISDVSTSSDKILNSLASISIRTIFRHICPKTTTGCPVVLTSLPRVTHVKGELYFEFLVNITAKFLASQNLETLP